MHNKKRILGLIVAALVATISFSFLSLHAQGADGRRIVIEIRNFKFAPKLPVLEPGDTVVWINKDIAPHTVTARDNSWSSGLIKAGGRWKLVVTAGLSTSYFCKYHPSMTGRLKIDSRRRS